MKNLVLDLNGEWQFCKAGTPDWLSAQVPGCNYSDLLRAGVIDDPYLGINEKKVAYVGKSDWIYRKKFTASDELCKQSCIRLICNRLDTICTLSLNGKPIGTSSNAHLKAEFDVKSVIREGENLLEIKFFSPVKYVRRKFTKHGAPLNSNGQNGIVHIRKPQYHFGWDWGPVLPLCGITDSINIQAFSLAEIEDIYVKQTHSSDSVRLDLCASIEHLTTDSVNWKLSLTHPDGNVEDYFGTSEGDINQTLIIKEPQLWWTHELSGKTHQPLYELVLSLVCGNTTICSKNVRLGLRVLSLDTSRDEYGNTFRFILNGVPIFAKGASIISYDSLEGGADKNRAAQLVNAALFANMNMLRIWGGASYGDDTLYELCDERGLLVWQDFCFACQGYPFHNDDFLQSVLSEVRYNVKRIRNHPSLALWCGNNELEEMSYLWCFMPKYIASNKKFFYDILPATLNELGANASYIPTSPCGSAFNKDISSDNIGDTHLWSVWRGFQQPSYFLKRFTRFCSEFGFESFPNEQTLAAFGGKPSFRSREFSAHQKCISGNAKIKFYTASRYRLPARFEDYIYLSQLNQAECIREAVEHWRRNKDRCNGALYWQLNDCWHTCSWSSVDYLGGYKALQYHARKFFAPLAINLHLNKDALCVWICNDTMHTISTEINIYIRDFDGKTLFSDTIQQNITNGTSVQIAQYPLSDIPCKNTFAQAELIVDNKQVQCTSTLFEAEKYVSLPKPNITVELKKIKDGIMQIRLTTDKYARFVRLAHDFYLTPFSDNYLDLVPNQSVTLTQHTDTLDESEYANGLHLTSFADIKPKSTPAYDSIVRTLILANPVNLFPYLFELRTPHD